MMSAEKLTKEQIDDLVSDFVTGDMSEEEEESFFMLMADNEEVVKEVRRAQTFLDVLRQNKEEFKELIEEDNKESNQKNIFVEDNISEQSATKIKLLKMKKEKKEIFFPFMLAAINWSIENIEKIENKNLRVLTPSETIENIESFKLSSLDDIYYEGEYVILTDDNVRLLVLDSYKIIIKDWGRDLSKFITSDIFGHKERTEIFRKAHLYRSIKSYRKFMEKENDHKKDVENN